MKVLGRYEIETYYVVVNSRTESRKRVIYYGNNNQEYFIERYFGTIRPGYEQSATVFSNLSYSDLKTNIVGESFVINDKSTPPMPLVYVTLSGIDSIQRDGLLRIVLVDSTSDPITLEFISEFHSNQANSLINLLLEDPTVDISNLGSDNIPPKIFFNQYFYNTPVILDGGINPATHSSDELGTFRVEVNLSNFSGPIPLTDSNIIDNLVHKVLDSRDGLIYLMEDNIRIYKNVINSSNLVTEISEVGNYIAMLDILDLSQNLNNTTVLISVI